MRDENGAFLGDDWTSISDIGRAFGGRTLSTDDYLRTENDYVDTAIRMLSHSGISSMTVTDIETHGIPENVIIDDRVGDVCSEIENFWIASGENMRDVIRGCLREYMWCRLSGHQRSYIHFSYDYYMYIGLPLPVQHLELPQGIFLEEFESPYAGPED